jgi:hypothetical protein
VCAPRGTAQHGAGPRSRNLGLYRIGGCNFPGRRSASARASSTARSRALRASLVWALTGGRAGSLTLFVGVTTAWLWISASAARARRPTSGP